MANPFYNYDGAFLPGQLARAEAVAAEFLSVQSGFSLLSYYGTDSGTANTYVVTTGGAPTGSYSNGQIVQFQAANTGTGASTINVNGVGVVPLTRFDGLSTQSGDIAAGVFYTAQYDAVNMKFRVTSPAAYTTSSSTVSGAAPTHKVGLTAAGGSSFAVAPIDVTFAIDTAISPTWSGTHTFSTPIAAGSGGTGFGTYAVGDILYASGTGTLARLADVATGSFLRSGGVGVAPAWGAIAAGDISGLSVTWSGTEVFTNAITVNGAGSSLKGGVTIATPASGVTLSLNTAYGGSAAPVVGATTAGGTGNFVGSYDGTHEALFGTFSSGGFVGTFSAHEFDIRTSNTARITVGSAGNATFNTPTSGVTATFNGVAGSAGAIVQVIGGSGGSAPIALQDGQTGNRQWVIEVGNPSIGSFRVRDNTAGADRMTINSAGNTVLNAPSSGQGLNVSGASGSYAIGVANTATAGSSFGMLIQAGGNSSDNSFIVTNRSGGTTFLLVRGDGLTQAVDEGGTLQTVGWRDVPQNAQNAGYTLVLADRGKHIYFNSVGTFTIPANASVAYTVGTVLTFYNATGSNCSIAINTDTLTLAGTASTGTRTLVSAGLASALKTAATAWVISGSGLS